jgi:Flp pilus assembly protein protease CpaA
MVRGGGGGVGGLHVVAILLLRRCWNAAAAAAAAKSHQFVQIRFSQLLGIIILFVIDLIVM